MSDFTTIPLAVGWRLLGHVGVDTGRIVIADPIYADGAEEALPNDVAEQYGPHDLSLVVCSGYGDGFYPVYGRVNDDGRVVEVRVLMDFDERNKVPE